MMKIRLNSSCIQNDESIFEQSINIERSYKYPTLPFPYFGSLQQDIDYNT